MSKVINGRECYPLTNAQKFHFFYMNFCPKKEVLNIGTSVTIQTDINWSVLRESIQEAYARCECLRVRFTKDDEGNWYQYVVDEVPQYVEMVDFSHLSMEESKKIMTKWSQVPFERENNSMSRIVMIRTSDGYSGIYFLVDHTLMDAQALICFMGDIIEIYCSKLFAEVPYPKPMASYIEQLKRDLAYEAGSKAQAKDREFFEKLIESSEPIFNGVHTGILEGQRKYFGLPELRAAVCVSDSVESALDSFHLEAEPTARIINFCEKYHVSTANLLMLGLRTYFQKVNGNDDVSINFAIARRATLKEKRSGGTRIHSFPLRTIIAKERTFLEALEEIRDRQNEMFRHANYDPVEYFAHRAKVYPGNPQGCTYEPMSLTYQPLALKSERLNDMGNISYKTVWYPNGATTQAMYLTVMHRPDDNGMDFNFEHQVKAISRQELEHFYYYLCKIIFKGIENPNLSIDEIMKLV